MRPEDRKRHAEGGGASKSVTRGKRGEERQREKGERQRDRERERDKEGATVCFGPIGEWCRHRTHTQCDWVEGRQEREEVI